MKAVLQEFITYMKEIKKASANTCLSYRNDLTKLVNYMYRQNITEADKLSETSLNSYVLTLEKEGMAPSTVSRNIASIKAFVLYLIKNGKLSCDPTERMKSPKVEKKPHSSLSPEEVNGLLEQPKPDTVKGMRDKAMLELLYATGIRVTELISIKLDDLNLKNRFLRCYSSKKERLIPFGNMAKHALENYFSLGRPTLVGDVKTDFLFTNLSGEQMSRQGFWKIIKGYGRNAGITREITPQILRNSFAAHMIANGADLRSIQEFLGHADITTTQYYVQGTDKKLTKVYADTHPRA
ncbi:tyrosine recombinase [Anaerocolumna xylanovorans]|uniref:Integrase/recombinase XerD n=1 Tax=Anaerocolumna xylanovorans DSM 12503 TaxID=1121345 RepID=A0A1M7YBS3_9FIRM|nr:tyrosine recombinase [Anaerocolumna xylanovorans]SHO50026.1 integrase/recombinase XerD [Anaerocolumna xylanovorans DSM 12503]